MTPREREVLVSLVRYADRSHHPAHNWCRHTPGVDPCEAWCPACDVLRDVADDVLIEARSDQR